MMKKNHITRTIIASAVLFSFNAAAAQRRHILKRVTMQWVAPG